MLLVTAAVVAVRAYTEENVAAVLLYCSITYYYCCVPVVDFTSPAAVVTLVVIYNYMILDNKGYDVLYGGAYDVSNQDPRCT